MRLGPRVSASLVGSVDTLAHWFPGLLLAGCGLAAYHFVHTPTPFGFFGLCALPYVVPLALFRLLTLLTPIREGGSLLAKGVWSPWFISYRLQLAYSYFPFLEGALLCVPGLFNAWLRAWGSHVGKRVAWGATVQITDRGHLVVGDDVFFGSAIYLSSHVVRRRGSRAVLYFKRITIGSGCFVGAGVRMGPGVVVDDGALVPLLTDLYVKARFPAPPEGVPA